MKLLLPAEWLPLHTIAPASSFQQGMLRQQLDSKLRTGAHVLMLLRDRTEEKSMWALQACGSDTYTTIQETFLRGLRICICSCGLVAMAWSPNPPPTPLSPTSPCRIEEIVRSDKGNKVRKF